MPKVHDRLPILASTDVAATVRHLVDRLDFEKNWITVENGEAIYASASLDGKSVLIQRALVPRSHPQASFWIDDADDFWREILSRGAIPTDVIDRSFGMREFSITVPGDVTLNFGSQQRS